MRTTHQSKLPSRRQLAAEPSQWRLAAEPNFCYPGRKTAVFFGLALNAAITVNLVSRSRN